MGLERPGLRAVARHPELPALGCFPAEGDSVRGLDQRVHPAGVRLAHAERDLPHVELRKAVALEARPGVSAVPGHVEPAARPAAHPLPGLQLEVPHPGVQDPGVVRVHDQVRSPGVLVHEQDVFPGLAPVRGPVDAALRLRGVGVAQRGRVHDVRVRRMDGDPADPRGRVEAHVFPGLPGVGGLEDPDADGDVRPDEGLAGARPDDVRVGLRDRERPDGVDVLVVEHRAPLDAPVLGLPDPPGGGPGVVDVRVARDAGDRERAVPDGADMPEPEPAELVRRRLGEGGRGEPEGEAEQERAVMAHRVTHGSCPPDRMRTGDHTGSPAAGRSTFCLQEYGNRESPRQ